MRTLRPGALCAASLSLLAAATPLAAQADTDACTLLTPAQVGAAVGVKVAVGARRVAIGDEVGVGCGPGWHATCMTSANKTMYKYFIFLSSARKHLLQV